MVLSLLAVATLGAAEPPPPPPPPPAPPNLAPTQAKPDPSATTAAPASPGPRERPPIRPSFQLNPGDRVLFLGDAFMEGEDQYGYLETRLTLQYPTGKIQFRNLSGFTQHPLGAPNPAAAGTNWLAPLLAQVARVNPTVVLLGYGTQAAVEGEASVIPFRTHYLQLVTGLQSLGDGTSPRMVIFSPLWWGAAGQPEAEAQRVQGALARYTRTLGEIATNLQAEFVDLYAWFERDEALLKSARTNRPAPPPSFEAGPRLTAYGYVRAAWGMERAFRWSSPTWRFGYLADGKLREGGFGANLIDYRRTEDMVWVKLEEERLPMPNPPGFVDLRPNLRPQCYVQVTGLRPGMYELWVERQAVAEGTHTDWGRYRIIGRGPSWDQAERLRQAIVRKNQAVAAVGRRAAEGASAGAGSPDDPAVKEAEAQIEALRRPQARIYELVRVGDAPSEEGRRTNP